MPGLRVLGIDPGTARVGYGVIDSIDNDRACLIAAGTVVTQKGLSLGVRLKEIHADLSGLIAKYRPDQVAVEELFFVRNVTTGMGVAMSQGVILLAASQAGLSIAGYVPMVVKKCVSGYGRAEKREVQECVRELLGLETIPRPDDAADALAVAICHLRHLSSTVFGLAAGDR